MKTIFRWIMVLVCGAALAGCAHKQYTTVSTSTKATDPGENKTDVRPDRMLIWTEYLTIQVDDVCKAVCAATTQTEALGGYVEQKSDSGDKSANLTLRIPSKAFKTAVNGLEPLGKVTRRNLTGEDVTEKYVDVDAQLKNLIALRDRLKQHLDKAADVKDIIAIETELNRVQTEIDSLQGQIKSLKSKADYATIQLTLERKTIPGPLGYVFNGIGWCIEKLFVIRQ